MTQHEILAAAESCDRQINEIIVHCSATREGRDFSAADIRRWHVADRRFSDIGYHFVVRLDGSIEAGRPLRRSGAHCRAHNRRSVGVCYIGGLDRNGHPADTRTPAQRASLLALLTTLRCAFPHASIHGHHDFAPKACPCFPATSEYSSL